MSTIRASLVGPISGTTMNLMSGLVKVWAKWNQTGTQAYIASFNCSSLTDTGTGQTTISFTSAFSGSTTYACQAMGRNVSYCMIENTLNDFATTSSIPVYSWNSSFSIIDCDTVGCVMEGTLA